MRLREIPLEAVDWSDLDARYEDRMCTQRKPWLDYLVRIGAGRPTVAVLVDGNREVGHFTGLVRKVFGVPVLASPALGSNTNYMGFNLSDPAILSDAMRTLKRYAFIDKKCAYVEVRDAHNRPSVAGYTTTANGGFISDLSASEDSLFAAMTSARRRNIRKAEREGLVVEEASPEGFAEEFHEQLTNVFAHQGRYPTYGVERVRALIECVHPSGMLLLSRVRTRKGQSIATGIYAGYGLHSTFWGNGSIRDMLQLRPNQALHWHAMRYWKQRGVRWHEWGGGGEYKLAYGPHRIHLTTHFWSPVPGLAELRAPALRAYYRLRSKAQRRP